MYQFNIENERLICRLHGKFDTLTSQKFDYDLEQEIKKPIEAITFDMKEVDYISSTFLRICVKTVKIAGKEDFLITNVSPSILMIFKIGGLADMCKIE